MRPGDEASMLINDPDDGAAFSRGLADEIAAINPQVSCAGAGHAFRRNDGGASGLWRLTTFHKSRRMIAQMFRSFILHHFIYRVNAKTGQHSLSGTGFQSR